MAEVLNNIEELVEKNEKLIDMWGRRNPKFEKKYEKPVMRAISDYGVGASENTSAKGKVFGSGYELYIMAFFIGLYAGKKLPLSEDTKVLGQNLVFWGTAEARKGRKAYPALRSYIFMALVAKTDIDWIALDKGEIKPSTVVSQLITTMEEYANYGFSVMEDKLKEDKGYFFSHRSFLDMFLQLTSKKVDEEHDEEEPEEL